MPWAVVLPVKRLATAKSRLTGVAPTVRFELALAFAVDTTTAALACSPVVAVVVVTDEPVVAGELADAGAHVVPDRPGAGLNAALVHGARVAMERHPGAAVAGLAADLPALRPTELQAALTRAGAYDAAFVPDHAGAGTTCLTARSLSRFRPEFGAGSANRHRSGGAQRLDLDLPSLRSDVDTVADLRAVIALGVGPATATLLRRFPDVLPLP